MLLLSSPSSVGGGSALPSPSQQQQQSTHRLREAKDSDIPGSSSTNEHADGDLHHSPTQTLSPLALRQRGGGGGGSNGRPPSAAHQSQGQGEVEMSVSSMGARASRLDPTSGQHAESGQPGEKEAEKPADSATTAGVTDSEGSIGQLSTQLMEIVDKR
jgi:hypothetical protein